MVESASKLESKVEHMAQVAAHQVSAHDAVDMHPTAKKSRKTKKA